MTRSAARIGLSDFRVSLARLIARSSALPRIPRLVVGIALAAPLLLAAMQSNAVTYTYSQLHMPTTTTGIDNPNATLAEGMDGNFYGTSVVGGSAGDGTVFKESTAGGAPTILHSFGDGSVVNDGANPECTLIQATDGDFYGTTYDGGTGFGTVFKITSAGAVTIVYKFLDGTDGEEPVAGVIQGADGNFYGTTKSANTHNNGTVFKVTSGGTLTTLHQFTGAGDGSAPFGGLIQGADSDFYGTTELGGAHSDGTVFKVTPAGVESIVYSFDGTHGADPVTSLIQDTSGNIYGTTGSGGAHSLGAIFEISSGTESVLYSFAGETGTGSAAPTTTDGSAPNGLVRGGDGYLYGTTGSGGDVYDNIMTSYSYLKYGTIFRIKTDGTSYSQLWNYCDGTLAQFDDGSDGGTLDGGDGANPNSSLIEDWNGNFFGTTYYGGDGDHTPGVNGPTMHPTGAYLTGSPGYGTYFELAPSTTLTPAAPTGLIGTASTGQVALAWTAASGAEAYRVYRGTTSGGETLIAHGLSYPSYTDTAVTNGTLYYYETTAVNTVGASGNSNEISATP